MRTMVGGVAAALLAVGGLAGCGGGSGGGTSNAAAGYCADLQNVQAGFANIQTFSLSQGTFDTLVGSLQRVQNEAPSGVKDDWASVASGINTFAAALKQSGMNLNQAAKMEEGKMPEMNMSSMEPLMVAAQALETTKFTNAATVIQQEVESDCHIDILSTK